MASFFFPLSNRHPLRYLYQNFSRLFDDLYQQQYQPSQKSSSKFNLRQEIHQELEVLEKALELQKEDIIEDFNDFLLAKSNLDDSLLIIKGEKNPEIKINQNYPLQERKQKIFRHNF